MKTNCEDCNKEIDDSDVLVEHYHRCDDCISEWLSAKKERIMKYGKCSKCKKIMKSKSKEEIDFWEFYGICFDCYDKDFGKPITSN